MKTYSKTAIFTAMGMIIALAGVPATANAQDTTNYDNRLALSFAPENPENNNEPFSQFDLHGTYDDAHELNDAWLGMPVRDAAGTVIGYVEDALLDQEGYLTELVVQINGSGTSVYVDQKHVDYTEIAVLVDLPIQSIASLEKVVGSSVE